MSLEGTIASLGLQEQKKRATVDQSRDRDPTGISFMTSEARNPKPEHQPVRYFEIFPHLLFLFPLFLQSLAGACMCTYIQKGLVCVQQQSGVGVGPGVGNCTALVQPTWEEEKSQTIK